MKTDHIARFAIKPELAVPKNKQLVSIIKHGIQTKDYLSERTLLYIHICVQR